MLLWVLALRTRARKRLSSVNGLMIWEVILKTCLKVALKLQIVQLVFQPLWLLLRRMIVIHLSARKTIASIRKKIPSQLNRVRLSFMLRAITSLVYSVQLEYQNAASLFISKVVS
ncbi:hypothetical protein BA3_0003 [Thalassomonas phage BA3]|uniref:hypothetical protein n=1 Tax=Thalassomonas phage BA3 TaxID=469660 RepID=UPI00015D9588|nr:hypothetical protein BA3_0003 [Thalassomonas phage BA3]ABV74288.1 hypothetical protein BA3_0003 [Thalassomonas phage BA3]